MVMQISAAAPSPSKCSFRREELAMLKNNSVYFLAVCVNFQCEIRKFELEVVVGMGILGVQGSLNISYMEIAHKSS